MAKTEPTKQALQAVVGVTQDDVKLPAGYKIARRVTTPLWSLTHQGALNFTVEGEMSASEGQEMEGKKQKPMTVVPVATLEDGELYTLIVPTVLESAFKRVPGGYVGKSFAALQGPKMPGKRYFQIELFELKGGK